MSDARETLQVKFEAWVRSKQYSDNFTKDGSGNYLSETVALAWEVWQAAYADAASACVIECDKKAALWKVSADNPSVAPQAKVICENRILQCADCAEAIRASGTSAHSNRTGIS